MGAYAKRLNKDTRVQQLREMYENGMSSEEIAEALDLGYKYVKTVLYRAHIATPQRKRVRPTREEFEEMCQTMTAGMISEHTGVAESTVRAWIREYGIHPLPAQRGGFHNLRKEVDCERAYNLYMQGFKPDAIANRLGVCWQTIRSRLIEKGYVLNKRKGDMYCINGGVDCYHHSKYSETCEYGSGKYCMYVCAGLGRRPCPSWDCTVYKKKNGQGLVERQFRAGNGLILTENEV